MPVAGRIVGDSACTRSRAASLSLGCRPRGAANPEARPHRDACHGAHHANRVRLPVWWAWSRLPASASAALAGEQLPESTPPVPVCRASGLGVEASESLRLVTQAPRSLFKLVPLGWSVGSRPYYLPRVICVPIKQSHNRGCMMACKRKGWPGPVDHDHCQWHET